MVWGLQGYNLIFILEFTLALKFVLDNGLSTIFVIAWFCFHFIDFGVFQICRLYPKDAYIECSSTADFRSTQEMVIRQPVPLPPTDEKMREDFLNFHYAGMLRHVSLRILMRTLNSNVKNTKIVNCTSKSCFRILHSKWLRNLNSLYDICVMQLTLLM